MSFHGVYKTVATKFGPRLVSLQNFKKRFVIFSAIIFSFQLFGVEGGLISLNCCRLEIFFSFFFRTCHVTVTLQRGFQYFFSRVDM